MQIPADYVPVPKPWPPARNHVTIVAKDFGKTKAQAKDLFAAMDPSEQQKYIEKSKIETAEYKAKLAEWKKGNNGWDFEMFRVKKAIKPNSKKPKRTPEEEAEIELILAEKRKEKEYKVHKAFCDAYEAEHSNGHVKHKENKPKTRKRKHEPEESSEEDEPASVPSASEEEDGSSSSDGSKKE